MSSPLSRSAAPAPSAAPRSGLVGLVWNLALAVGTVWIIRQLALVSAGVLSPGRL